MQVLSTYCCEVVVSSFQIGAIYRSSLHSLSEMRCILLSNNVYLQDYFDQLYTKQLLYPPSK